MNRIIAARASTILYNLLISRTDTRLFLLPANICPIVPITFLKAGRSFEFIDISQHTLNMDSTSALRQIRHGKVGGILYSRTYGDPSAPGDFFKEAKQLDSSVLIIDDRCLCIPELQADPSSMADVILYSTGHAKIVDLSYGGYAFLQESVSYQASSLRFQIEDLQKLEQAYKSSVASHQPFEYRDSDWLESNPAVFTWERYAQQINAALGASLQHRQRINTVYSTCLPPNIQLPGEMQLWRFHIRVPNRALILERIFTEKLFASSHYASLAGIMGPGWCPEAEDLASKVINLFNDHHYTTAMAEQTCEIITGML